MIEKIKDIFKHNKIKAIAIAILIIALLFMSLYLFYKFFAIILLIIVIIFLAVIGSKKNNSKKIDISIDNKKEIIKSNITGNNKLIKKNNQKDLINKIEKDLLNLKIKNDDQNREIVIDATLYEDGKPVKKFHTVISSNKKLSDELKPLTEFKSKSIEKRQTEEKAYPIFAGFLRNNIKDETVIEIENKKETLPLLKEKIEKYCNYEKNENVDNLYICQSNIKNKIDNSKNSKLKVVNEKKEYNEKMTGDVFLSYIGVARKEKKVKLSNEELLACAYVSKYIRGITNENRLKFYKENGIIYVDSTNIGFKVNEEGNYCIIPKNEKTSLKIKECSENENKKDNKRAYFNDDKDLDNLSNYIRNELSNKNKNKKKTKSWLFFTLTEKDTKRIIKKEQERRIISTYEKLAGMYRNSKEYGNELRILQEAIAKLKAQKMSTKKLEKRMKEVTRLIKKDDKKKEKEKELKKKKENL